MTTAQDGGKVVNPTHRPPLSPGSILGIHFCQRLNQPRGHSAVGSVMSTKNSSDNIWNRTRDLPACSAVPQPTVPPRTPILRHRFSKFEEVITGNPHSSGVSHWVTYFVKLFSSPKSRRPAPGPRQPPIQWVPSFFAWGKATGAWYWPLTSKLTVRVSGVILHLPLYAFIARTRTPVPLYH